MIRVIVFIYNHLLVSYHIATASLPRSFLGAHFSVLLQEISGGLFDHFIHVAILIKR